MKSTVAQLLLVAAFGSSAVAQQQRPLALSSAGQIVSAEISRPLLLPIQCDGDGNIYVRGYQFPNPQLAPIMRISPKGVKEAEFSAGEFKEGTPSEAFDFVVLPDGEVLQAIGVRPTDLYVVRFRRDGRIVSTTRIEQPMMPYRMAPLGGDSFLLSGTTLASKDKPETQSITAIYGSTGTLVRKLEPIHTKDKTPVESLSTSDFGTFLSAPDGKLLFVERAPNPHVRSIGADGTTSTLFRIASPESDMKAETTKWSAGRLYTQFMSIDSEGSIKKTLYTVTDGSTGDLVATYQLPEQTGAAFACVDSEGFTFLNGKDGKIVLTRIPFR